MAASPAGLLESIRSRKNATIGAGTPPASARGSRTPCQISATFPVRSCGAAAARNFSIKRSSPARGPGSAAGPELISVSEPGLYPPMTASRATRPPKECPSRCVVPVTSASAAMSAPSCRGW